MKNYQFNIVEGGTVQFSKDYDLHVGDIFHASGFRYLVLQLEVRPNGDTLTAVGLVEKI